MANNSKASILIETRDSVVKFLKGDLSDITVDRVVLGLFFTGVKLSNNFGGISQPG